jgi:hypothetical protein
VHRVRKESKGHRGIRPGVLTRRVGRGSGSSKRPAAPTPRAAASAARAITRVVSRVCAAALFAGILALASCAKGKAEPIPVKQPTDPRAVWFQLSSGKLSRIDGIDSVSPAAFAPWTVQSRVTDAAFLRGTFYFAVNGSGIARLGFEGGGPVFGYFYDSLICPYRTVTTIVPRQGVITAHLYFNELLNTAAPAQLPLGGICLVSYIPSTGEYSFLMPPFQKKHPEWEAVGFLPVGTEDFFFEWKRSDQNETSFAYTRFSPSAGTETAVSREAYIESFQLSAVKAPGKSAAREALFALCRSRLPELEEGTALHFIVRSGGDPLRRVFRLGEGSSGLVTIPVFEEKGNAFALLTDGKVLRIPVAAAAETITLPPLPAGFHYTNVMRVGDFLFIPWEQAVFTDVGAAGVLLYKIAP